MGFVNEVPRYEYQQYNLRHEKASNKQDFIPVNHTIPVYLQTRYEDSNGSKKNEQPIKYKNRFSKNQKLYSEKKERLIAELSGKGQNFREYA